MAEWTQTDSTTTNNLFVSLVYCAESTVRWFIVREKHCWMAADSADKSKRTGRKHTAGLRIFFVDLELWMLCFRSPTYTQRSDPAVCVLRATWLICWLNYMA
jgi:hypothetical protein